MSTQLQHGDDVWLVIGLRSNGSVALSDAFANRGVALNRARFWQDQGLHVEVKLTLLNCQEASNAD